MFNDSQTDLTGEPNPLHRKCTVELVAGYGPTVEQELLAYRHQRKFPFFDILIDGFEGYEFGHTNGVEIEGGLLVVDPMTGLFMPAIRTPVFGPARDLVYVVTQEIETLTRRSIPQFGREPCTTIS